jgi:hypothetical protein
MIKDTTFIVPHRLDFGSGFCRAPSRAWKEIMQTVWQLKPCTVSEIHLSKIGKQPIITDFFYGLYFGQHLTDHVLKKRKRPLVHTLMDGFRRHLYLLVQVRHLRRQLRQCRCGIIPGPKGDESQKQFAGQLRRTFDKASATRGGFDVV